MGTGFCSAASRQSRQAFDAFLALQVRFRRKKAFHARHRRVHIHDLIADCFRSDALTCQIKVIDVPRPSDDRQARVRASRQGFDVQHRLVVHFFLAEVHAVRQNRLVDNVPVGQFEHRSHAFAQSDLERPPASPDEHFVSRFRFRLLLFPCLLRRRFRRNLAQHRVNAFQQFSRFGRKRCGVCRSRRCQRD